MPAGFLTMLLMGAAAATVPPADPPPRNLDIRSDELTVVPGTHQVVARGHVHAVGTTFEADCDHGEATYGEAVGGKRSIEVMVLHDQVKMHRFSDGTIAEGSQAVYTAATKEVVLTGNPIVTRGADVLRGEQITVGLDGDWMKATQPKVDLVRKNRPAPTHIRAEQLQATEGGKRLRFDRNVHLQQANMTARSDRLDADVDNSAGDSSEITHAVLIGHVVAHRGNQEATGGRAIYEGATGNVTLLEHPVVTEDGTTTEGEQIVIDGNTGHARVTKAITVLPEGTGSSKTDGGKAP